VKKSQLHPRLQTTAVPVLGHSDCYAVVPATPELPQFKSSLMFLAHREMQQLAAAARAAPKYSKLLMHMLNRREAVESSQIEGTHTQLDALLLHEIEAGTPDATADPDADVTLNYLRAYTWGVQQATAGGVRALDVPLICKLHAHLMLGDARSMPGKWRNTQNWIGGFNIEQARFIPPPADLVPQLMSELPRLILAERDPESHYRLGVLARAPIVHAQFEAIHPFIDGNGRVGRLLFPLMFVAEEEPPIHLATFLKLRQREYYDALLDVQMRLRWDKWIELYLECTIASCRNTIDLLRELASTAERWHRLLEDRRVRRHATAWRLIDHLLGQPVVTVNAVASALQISFAAANSAVTLLLEMDILRAQNEQRRNRAFQAHEVMNFLYTGLDEVLNDVSALQNYQ
jgi:Fic family protein